MKHFNQSRMYNQVVKINQQYQRAIQIRNAHKTVVQAVTNPMILNKPKTN